jgi:hypothetical protein
VSRAGGFKPLIATDLLTLIEKLSNGVNYSGQFLTATTYKVLRYFSFRVKYHAACNVLTRIQEPGVRIQ